ncbi:MAG: ribonuclease HI family protein [Patescibacteria group bacterium]|nr:ribonuclease HI family protein [Patescibacteria group bacterium]
MKIARVYIDGGSRGNPGQGSIAVAIFLGKKNVFQDSRLIGLTTNNDAEYQALIWGLEKILEIKDNQMIKKVIFQSDSQLLINQLTGKYKVRSKKIKEHLTKIKLLEKKINLPILYKKIPREKNQLADRLVNLAFVKSKLKIL